MPPFFASSLPWLVTPANRFESMDSPSELVAAVMDFNNPLYLHHFYTPGVKLVSQQLIGSENYGTWSRAMLVAFLAKNNISFIDGLCIRHVTCSFLIQQWERCDAIVISWVLNSMSKEFLVELFTQQARSSCGET